MVSQKYLTITEIGTTPYPHIAEYFEMSSLASLHMTSEVLGGIFEGNFCSLSFIYDIVYPFYKYKLCVNSEEGKCMCLFIPITGSV
jgi:hypothetical protein